MGKDLEQDTEEIPETEDVQEFEDVTLHENEDELEVEETEETEPESTDDGEVESAESNEPIFLTELEVSEILENSKLPEISKDRLVKSNYVSETELQNIVHEEEKYIAKLIKSGEPNSLGETDPLDHKLSESELIEDHQKRLDEIIFG